MRKYLHWLSINIDLDILLRMSLVLLLNDRTSFRRIPGSLKDLNFCVNVFGMDFFKRINKIGKGSNIQIHHC